MTHELDPNLPRLQDMFQTFLRELRPEALSGSQGSYQLRMEILRRVNLVIAPAKVVTSALSNAASIAGLMLTTEVLVTRTDDLEGGEKPKVEGAVR